jgi:hypothetical protein
LAAEALRHLARRRAAAEEVHHEVPRTREELDEELRERCGEARRVRGEAFAAASPQVLVVRDRVGGREQIPRNGPAVVYAECTVGESIAAA